MIIIIAIILSAILYRLGGSAKNGSWYDFLKWSKTRDWGCSIVWIVTAGVMLRWLDWWWYIPMFICSWLALTTYWDDLFGYDNYWFHLGVVALCMLPYAFYGYWLLVVIRIIVSAGFGALSHKIDKTSIPYCDVISENIRGIGVVL